MLDFSVSVLPLVVVAAANFVLSWLWYSPLLFMKPWAKALGFDAKGEMTEEDKKAMPGLFLSAVVVSFILSYGLQVVVRSVGAESFAQGFLVGVVLWAVFALTHSLNTLWEGRKPVVLAVNNGLFLVSYALFSGIVAVWR